MKRYNLLREDEYFFGREIVDCGDVRNLDKEVKEKVGGNDVLVVCVENERLVWDGNEWKKIGEMGDMIWALCSYEGKLYETGNYGVCGTLKNKLIIRFDKSVKYMVSVDRGMLGYG